MRNFLLGPVVRLAPIGLLTLAFQRVLFARHPLFHFHGVPVKAQLVLALVVAAGAGGGADRGAIAGFVLGLMYDLSSNTPLGVTALAYGLAGLVAGYVQTITPDPQWWLASIFAGIGAAFGEISVPFLEAVTGQSGWVQRSLWVSVPVVAGFAAVVCTPLMPVGRWIVGAKRRKWKAIVE
jgi:rod shape-determining protein MreD